MGWVEELFPEWFFLWLWRGGGNYVEVLLLVGWEVVGVFCGG
jgi:hypothetical protein